MIQLARMCVLVPLFAAVIAVTGCPPETTAVEEVKKSAELRREAALKRSRRWEDLEHPRPLWSVHRTRVPAGWLVTFDIPDAHQVLFVEDPGHRWGVAAVGSR